MEETRKELERYKLALDNASDHIVISDKDGKIVYANKAASKITGYSRDEIIGTTPRLWGGQMPKEFYEKFWYTIKEEKKSFQGEVTNRRKNGEVYDAEIKVAPVLNNQGAVEFFVGIERDITHEKQVDRAKTEFVSLASHQLRTPLSIINWYAEMIEDGDAGSITEKQKEYLEEITSASKRMTELVNALLNVSRIEMGTFIVEPEKVVVQGVIEEVINDLQQRIKEKNLSIEKDIADPELAISADKKLLHVIIENILTNAVKYTQEEGEILIGQKEENEDLLIWVKDNGCGIPKLEQKNIFEKFFRASNVVKKDTQGTGLGLYIVKSIMDQIEGTIRFESEEGRGTAFYLQFPKKGMREKGGTKELS
jgi:PAS domain S-box-containing protein